MHPTSSDINVSVIFLSVFNFFSTKSKQHKNNTYDYTQFVDGRDYVFEPVDNMTKGYMTGQFKGIKNGDYIILPKGANSERYQVEEIDYYSEPPDMWIALLKKVSVESKKLLNLS